MDINKIEEKIDKAAAGSTEVSMSLGGVQFQSMMEVMEFSKLMAVSGEAVPPHLRGNPGACLAIMTKALRFGFEPFSLAEHSYRMVKSAKIDGQWKEDGIIAFDSFVIHSIIEAHGNLTGPLQCKYEGEGDARVCIVTGQPKGSKVALEHRSPTLGDIKKSIGRNDKGKLRGSQLWDSPKSDQQLWYDTRRDWCRKYQPQILLGWYDKDEFDEPAIGPDRAKDVTPKPDLAKRLPGKSAGRRGFDHDHVERHTRKDETSSEAKPDEAKIEADTPAQQPAEPAPA